MKVALVGCGQIAFAHLSELSFLKGVQVNGVCDVHQELAEDAADLFSIPRWYTNHLEMLDDIHPDVVHITVPPAYQKSIALDALRKGCSVYIEKPFCVNAQETLEVIEEAKRKGVLACAGFSQVFDIPAIRLREYIATGKLGEVVHIESSYGNDLGGEFSKLFLSNQDHWLHRLPGKLFQNILTHPLIQIAPYLRQPIKRIDCWSNDYSKNGYFDDELRLMVLSGNVSAYVTFSSAIRPLTQSVRVYGTKSIAEVDFTNHTFSVMDCTTLPGTFARIRNPVSWGVGLIKEGLMNSMKFMCGKDRFFRGMGGLFERFYRAVEACCKEPPIPYDQVMIVADILDRVGEHCSTKSSSGKVAI